ncbi:MAG TPA: hypothetical protein VHB73_01570 [Alphaproteobacteria bacterium]|nr:hypothetical protein [Alphaproteobacteria bacterium]
MTIGKKLRARGLRNLLILGLIFLAGVIIGILSTPAGSWFLSSVLPEEYSFIGIILCVGAVVAQIWLTRLIRCPKCKASIGDELIRRKNLNHCPNCGLSMNETNHEIAG